MQEYDGCSGGVSVQLWSVTGLSDNDATATQDPGFALKARRRRGPRPARMRACGNRAAPRAVPVLSFFAANPKGGRTPNIIQAR